jgi:tRNA-2-methylthio-N6-dimethylallyladenosine synthase
VSEKLFVKTFGCQMNEYDSSRMADLLAQTHQLQATTEECEADVLLLNTCSVREKAQEKVFSQLGRWRKLKDKKPGLVIGVGGCVASQEGEMIMRRAPYVDIVFGPQTLHRLPKMLDEVRNLRVKALDISFPEIEKFDCLPPPKVEGAKAFVSIMEGCSKYCSFCVVPYTRGTEFSRPFDDVITEVYELAEQGVREVNLLGQNVNGYVGKAHEGDEISFAELLRFVAAVEGIDRVRYTTSHPLHFDDELIEVYRDTPQLVSHLHLPVQAGSDRILNLMKRGYSVEYYKNVVARLREARPNISLSSDFIIGFPGESDEDFEQTMSLIEDINFDQSFSFIYSQRPGTPAAELPDDVSMEVKKARLARLQARINEMASAISAAMVGSEQVVLVNGPSRKNPAELTGKTQNHRSVTFLGDPAWVGRFVRVKITQGFVNSLRGEALGLAENITAEVA